VSLAKTAVEKSTFTGFATVLFLLAGLYSYTQLGQLEDPEFTIKSATVTTTYPGATAEEVELEVTDRIELAIQEMPQVKFVESLSRPGLSLVKLDIKPHYLSRELPQIWDELRKKVGDVRGKLPPGAGEPVVGDDFGDVYGFLLAVTGDGFTYAELENYVDDLKKELSLVDGVARVELWGVQTRCIYIDVQQSQLSQLGIAVEDIQRTLEQQNLVVDSGGLDLPEERLRIEQTGAFRSPEDIGDLIVRGASFPRVLANDELLRIRDIATVRTGYVEPPLSKLRYQSAATRGVEMPALALAVANASGANVVELGRALDERLAELTALLPAGIELHKISWQSDLVDESIVAFMVSLLEAVAIVLVVLWLVMGLRVATIVGVCGLVFVIVMTFPVMLLWGIDLQRMSLGALIIAMGMMVDNAIVVADGILVRLGQGMDRRQAAIEAATQPSWPLLGATVIAVMAFYPIYASTESAGEYCASLFQVVAVSLLLSWVLSVTVTPLMSIWLLKPPQQTGEAADPYGSRFYRGFRGLLELGIRRRWGVVGLMIVLLVVSLAGFGFVDRTFFPDSARLQLMIDYWAPEGTRIQTVSEDLRQIEDRLVGDERVASVSTFMGQGPPRFYLPVEPEKPYSSYGQLIINFHDLKGLNQVIPEIDAWMRENVPQALTIVRRYGLGPSKTWKVELRLSGPALADKTRLRELGEQGVDILKSSPFTQLARTNWRQRVPNVLLEYSDQRARWASVSRSDIARATKRAYDGYAVGQYREEDKLYPILLRHVEKEREQLAANLRALQVHPSFSPETVPLAQVVGDVRTDEWDDPLIWRRDRRRTITLQANPPDGVPADAVRQSVMPQLAQFAASLPPGYRLEWGGEYESSRDSQQSLIPGVIPAAVIVALIIVGLFNAFRPPLIIFCVIPFAMIGVTVGLLATGQPFGFLALLGAMSLAGMMIKNAIVLLDQIDIERAAGKSPYQAVVDSALSRLRPVVLAAATTVLGVVPLLQDVFWVAMAVTIMFGLAFGTVLTMFLLPVLYACFFRIRSPER